MDDRWQSNALGQEARKYDSRKGIGSVESGTETENNAGRLYGFAVSIVDYTTRGSTLGVKVVEQCMGNRRVDIEEQLPSHKSL